MIYRKEVGMSQQVHLINSGEQSTPLCIEVLVAQLQSLDGSVRIKARDTLIHIGKQASPAIIQLLAHQNEFVRWEACKTLEHLRDPETARSLAQMLLDENMDVRWVAADALIELEQHAVVPVLEIIEEHFESAIVREAAHHVLHSLKEQQLADEITDQVLEALKMSELPSKAAFIAEHALDYYRTHEVPKRPRHLV